MTPVQGRKPTESCSSKDDFDPLDVQKHFNSGKRSSLVRMRSGLYHKPITTVNDDSGIVNKLKTSLIDDNRAVIYDCHMFIVQATGVYLSITDVTNLVPAPRHSL